MRTVRPSVDLRIKICLKLCECLGIPEKITWMQRTVFGMEGLCILLRRLAYLVNTQTWYPAMAVIRWSSAKTSTLWLILFTIIITVDFAAWISSLYSLTSCAAMQRLCLGAQLSNFFRIYWWVADSSLRPSALFTYISGIEEIFVKENLYS